MGIGGKSEILSYFSSGSHQPSTHLEGAVGSGKLRFAAQPGLRIVITTQEIARTFIFIRNNNLGILHRIRHDDARGVFQSLAPRKTRKALF